MPRGRELRSTDACQLADAFRHAAIAHHYTEKQIQDWALDRLHASNGKNPVSWVLNAFSDAALDREPVAESLSLPDPSVPGSEQQVAVEGIAVGTLGEALAEPVDRSTGELLPPWCGECNDQGSAAAERKLLRVVGYDAVPCPQCHPSNVSADMAHGESA